MVRNRGRGRHRQKGFANDDDAADADSCTHSHMILGLCSYIGLGFGCLPFLYEFYIEGVQKRRRPNSERETALPV